MILPFSFSADGVADRWRLVWLIDNDWCGYRRRRADGVAIDDDDERRRRATAIGMAIDDDEELMAWLSTTTS
ncbi:hypothetical protein Q3G72_020377 [Acer saccharum]|nr:hypothetical protein Q3G72_020377 [Acer saccharum]